ncbi:MAG: hypothetical protein QNJ32_23985 [Xenococcaceae cyanobacterium MO_167.B27]|nr:hypothetical protein [Xenococcaceae cyanobacterium MO_167.B27]
MTYTAFKTEVPTACTCESCSQFKNYRESRGRGYCKLFDKVAFSHHPFTNDCRLNLATDTEAKKETTDYLGQQIRETRLMLEKSKYRHSLTNQLSLKAPF